MRAGEAGSVAEPGPAGAGPLGRDERSRRPPCAGSGSLATPAAAVAARGRPRSAPSRRSAATRCPGPVEGAGPPASDRRRRRPARRRNARSVTSPAATSGPRSRALNGSPASSYAAAERPSHLAVRPSRTAAAPRPGCCPRRPPGDDLALGPGERDVEQPEVLAGLLGLDRRHRSARPGPHRPPTSSTQSPARRRGRARAAAGSAPRRRSTCRSQASGR